MLSWHKPGQKVVCITKRWRDVGGRLLLPEGNPLLDEICTIDDVKIWGGDMIVLHFMEYPGSSWNRYFSQNEFRPVYPQIIDSLREVSQKTPARVLEDA